MNTNVTTIIHWQTPTWAHGHWSDRDENLDETHEKFDVEICGFCTSNNGETSVNKDGLPIGCKQISDGEPSANEDELPTRLAVSNEWRQWTMCEQGWVINQVRATSDGELGVNKDGLPTRCEQQVMANHVWTRKRCQPGVSKKWWQTMCKQGRVANQVRATNDDKLCVNKDGLSTKCQQGDKCHLGANNNEGAHGCEQLLNHTNKP
jgi:hypothetical protein